MPKVAWKTWDREAFDEAKRDDKPILLSISAVWCHWCHVMDGTSYADPEIVSAINERYVPIRVDNDRRPDINARYNQGGWPTTAFLTPGGALMAGGTYLPPHEMRAALERVADFYKENRDHIEERAAQLRAREPTRQEPSDLSADAIAAVAARIEEAYDPEYGGFGTAPKFPMTDALEFLLQEYRFGGETRLYDIVATSMLGMSGGGMYDPVEGGFFRYSTTRDWSVPHFEKMAEDHAALLRILATLARITRNARFRTTLVSALSYVRMVLRDPQSALFAGSQDADEAYYALPLDERRARTAPYVDRTSYSNWTAALAGSFAIAGAALDDDRVVQEGEAALDALHERLRDGDGLLAHFIEPGGEPQVHGLLSDQSAYLRALLDAHEFVGEPRFYDRAVDLAAAIERRFAAPGGGFYDHAGIETTLGALDIRDRPLPENASLAESFLRLAALELGEEERLRDLAARTLRVYSGSYAGAGLFAAPYARALRRYLATPVTVTLAGTPAETAELREAAHALPEPFLAVRTVADASRAPGAYVCRANVCAAPAATAAQLRDAYEGLNSSRE